MQHNVVDLRYSKLLIMLDQKKNNFETSKVTLSGCKKFDFGAKIPFLVIYKKNLTLCFSSVGYWKD